MIVPRIQFDPSRVIRGLGQLPELTRKITAQELNRQRRQSRTRLIRGLTGALGVTRKRAKGRIWLPRGGFARPRHLVASGLALIAVFPARWFAKGQRGRGGGFNLSLPSGTAVVERHAMTGQAFRVQLPRAPVVDVVRRRDPIKKGREKDREGGRTWLPIQKLEVDVARVGARVLDGVLASLAREWPDRFARRFGRELKRRFA